MLDLNGVILDSIFHNVILNVDVSGAWRFTTGKSRQLAWYGGNGRTLRFSRAWRKIILARACHNVEVTQPTDHPVFAPMNLL